MKLLCTGKGGKSGSWAIRAIQLGEALGAEIQPLAEPSDCKAADLIIVVKRTPLSVINAIRSSGRPWVYDVVDGWPQPCTWGEMDACAWLRGTLAHLAPTAVVFGTRRMQADSGFTGPSLVLPHHAWPKYSPNPVRQNVEVVGYEGSPAYLGRWRAVVESECRRRGWRFDINGNMQHADIGIALRDAGGYPAKQWKPGTKLANLQALGIPALCSPERGYREIASGSEYWIERPDQVAHAFDELSNVTVRASISAAQNPPRLEQISQDYRAWLSTLRF